MARKNARPPATCHPDRPHLAKGLCKPCYDYAYARKNRGRANEAARRWRLNNPEKMSAIRRKYLYGVPQAQYDALYRSQDGRCAICATPQEVLHVDHDHTTHRIRGLLCGNCNRGLGIFGDDPNRLVHAAFYLEDRKN